MYVYLNMYGKLTLCAGIGKGAETEGIQPCVIMGHCLLSSYIVYLEREACRLSSVFTLNL